MDYEKLYKESLERAKKLHKYAITLQLEQDIKDYEYIFPVLAESEDERIRNLCEVLVRTCFMNELCTKEDKDECIAWLEKQRKQEINDEDTIQRYSFYSYKGEPTFKVGDWIISNVSHEDYRICKILKIEHGEYVIESIYGYKGYNNFETFDKDYHLWSIEDAKDGDVLQLGKVTAIFKEFIGNENCRCYCSVYEGEFEIPSQKGDDNSYGYSNATPSTKEQRDLLFQKMKEAGYKWDAEKKKLKKIDSYCQEHCKGYQETGKCFVDGECQAKKEAEQNSVWSEEDERLCGCLIEEQEESLDNVRNDKYGHSEIISDLKDMYRERIDWLKSLKERIKG